MNLTQLEVLDAIASSGGFGKAAERLGRNQPAISKLVQALEAELGVQIFDRTPGGARLTAAGDRLLKRARTVLSDVHALKEEAADILGAQGGSVRIGVSPAAATALAPEACRRLLQRFPQAEVEIVPALYPGAAESLRDASLDLVIGPAPERVSPDLLVERLFDMPVEVVTHDRHPKRGATSLAELSGERWIVHGPAEGPSSLYAAAFDDGAAGRPRIRCHSIAATLALLAPLNAFCVLSRPVFLHNASHYRIAAAPIRPAPPAFQMSMLTSRGHAPTPTAQHMADCIRQVAARAAV